MLKNVKMKKIIWTFIDNAILTQTDIKQGWGIGRHVGRKALARTLAPTAAGACPGPTSGPAGVDSRPELSPMAHPGALTLITGKKARRPWGLKVVRLLQSGEPEDKHHARVAPSITLVLGAFQELVPPYGILFESFCDGIEVVLPVSIEVSCPIRIGIIPVG